jgi:hypothetical protein
LINSTVFGSLNAGKSSGCLRNFSVCATRLKVVSQGAEGNLGLCALVNLIVLVRVDDRELVDASGDEKHTTTTKRRLVSLWRRRMFSGVVKVSERIESP